jgi:hypothetical protein
MVILNSVISELRTRLYVTFYVDISQEIYLTSTSVFGASLRTVDAGKWLINGSLCGATHVRAKGS